MHIRLGAVFALFSILPCTVNLYAIDDLFRFRESSTKEKIQFETERKLCFFPLRNLGGESNIDYFSSGYASVFYSNLKSIVQIYDEEMLPVVVQHPFGKNSNQPGGDSGKKNKDTSWNSEKLEKLKKGELHLPVSKDPRYISLRSEPYEKEIAPDDGVIINVAKKNGCFYSVYGEYEKKAAEEMRIRILLLSLKEGSKKEFSHTTSVRRSYQELNPLIDQLRKFLLGRETYRLQLKVSNTTGALVFLDGNYIGKTPLVRNDLLPGIHELRVSKEGFEEWKDQLDMRVSSKEIQLELLKEKREGLLSVETDPSGVKVYLGMEYLGETPLQKVPVRTGWNRIRFSKEGYIDSFQGVEIKKDSPIEVKAKLKEGDSSAYYANKKYLFLDHTYDDFAIYSLYGTLLFYAGYYYFNLKADSVLEGTRPQVTLTNFAAVQALQQSSPDLNTFATAFFYQDNLVQHARDKANHYRSISGKFGRHQKLHGGIMLYGIAAMIALTITFYALGLDSETVDIGIRPVRSPIYTNILENQFETETYARFLLRF
ncbi:PEGA domain protein [Leptospira perolatii]|uniref:PEGA domain protein n=1 Tax=Leptospira perolatii TaxID=2023191 RepID=A0A2M9ZSP2_9LEPT|nr:PEGA domain-containing protein [Leptospira perolatii]PJZ68737.1 PEGA domain protein [Leptospira perolatii]PJZ75092.1 PEGA domain protein [Leptospira perolatii]